ncbi:hypothetical protein U1Q18_009233 [Sarracenia purpurea var. burkii]
MRHGHGRHELGDPSEERRVTVGEDDFVKGKWTVGTADGVRVPTLLFLPPPLLRRFVGYGLIGHRSKGRVDGAEVLCDRGGGGGWNADANWADLAGRERRRLENHWFNFPAADAAVTRLRNACSVLVAVRGLRSG